MKTLNVVGCGKVGKTLARLWARHGVFRLGCVLNRSLQSSCQAVDFVGAGRPVEHYEQMDPAQVVMIATPDEVVEACGARLARAGVVGAGTIVFHCSGALPSTVLEPARGRGARIASAHPVKSFADAASAAETFAGTFCALEGDPEACALLRDALGRVGAVVFAVLPELKPIYHAATVFVSNYLVALAEVGLRCFEKAGLDRPSAIQVAEPLVRGTVENLFRLGPVRALTGPIARGEVSVVARQADSLARWDETVRQLYAALGRVGVELSSAQGSAPAEALRSIRAILGEGS